jgi:hypothetical protein
MVGKAVLQFTTRREYTALIAYRTRGFGTESAGGDERML